MRAIGAVLRRLRTRWFKGSKPVVLDHPRADRFGLLDLIEDRLFRPAVLRNDRALSSFSGEIATLGLRQANRLAERNMRVFTAESCTAGLLGACVGAAPGTSAVLEGSFIAYRPTMKIDGLGVPDALVRDGTVYDPDVARAMAESALSHAKRADLAIALTGVAGPEPDRGKPVGLVYIATLRRGATAQVTEWRFSGQPKEIVAATLRTALDLGLAALN